MPVTSDNCAVASITNNAPTVYALGTNAVMWIVTDASGNTNTCTQRVIVRDAINPTTRVEQPRQAEYDLTVDYRPPWLKPTFLRGLWFRARGAVLDQEHAKQLGYQFRLTINWERDIF